MQQIVLASGNKGKLREFNQLFQHYQIEIVPQGELGVTDADETGLSFIENAILKARHASQITGLAAIADDSGLEVDALQGAPGIYSARYAGTDTTDEKNNAKLLADLALVETAQRTARFHCVLAWVRHAKDPTPIICHGTWEGRILTAAQGDNGFGYDPLFWIDELNCSSAELDSERKNQLSHRGQAMAKLATYLASPAI